MVPLWVVVLCLLQLPPCLAGFRPSVVVGLQIVAPVGIGIRPIVGPPLLAVRLVLFSFLPAQPAFILLDKSCQ